MLIPPSSTLAYFLHNFNPYVFKIGPFGPRWYGLAYLMGFLLAYLLLKKLNRDGMLRLAPQRVPDFVLNCCIFGVLIGGRLGFVLFYDLPISLAANRTPLLLDFSPLGSSGIPFWGVLRVWDGGMAAHGGIIFTLLTLMVFSWRQFEPLPSRLKIAALITGVFLAGAVGYSLTFLIGKSRGLETGDALSLGVAGAMAFAIGWMTWFGWKHAVPVINMGDAACMVVPIGLFFGRCANFINGELYGHPTTVPWAVKFPSEIYAPTNGIIDPTVDANLPQALANLHLPVSMIPDKVTQESLRILNERLAAHDPQAVNAVADILLPRHPSQLYEACLEGALLFLICWTIGRLWRKEGMASGAFLTFYPIMRIIGEQFRVGDTPIHIFGADISKGIIYSIPMALAGAMYWGYWINKDRRIPWVPPPPKTEAEDGKAKAETSKG